MIMLSLHASGQEDDLLSLLGEEETVNYTTATLKATRVLNPHSLENMTGGALDIRISYRFAFIHGGI